MHLQFRGGAEHYNIQWRNYGRRVRQQWFARGHTEEARLGRWDPKCSYGHDVVHWQSV